MLSTAKDKAGQYLHCMYDGFWFTDRGSWQGIKTRRLRMLIVGFLSSINCASSRCLKQFKWDILRYILDRNFCYIYMAMEIYSKILKHTELSRLSKLPRLGPLPLFSCGVEKNRFRYWLWLADNPPTVGCAELYWDCDWLLFDPDWPCTSAPLGSIR